VTPLLRVNSYGFRPGRGCHDAIQAIFQQVCQQAKYVLDADIKGAFDHLSQPALLNRLATYPAMRQTIKAWLQAGVMDAGTWMPTEEGAPQGGVLSPLLMNVALHGMETALQGAFTRREGKPTLVRYADDFAVFHPSRAGVEKAGQIVESWLKEIGLNLKPSKTRITHTLEGDAGFEFLGFQVRQHPVGRRHSGTNRYGKPLGFKTLIKPSKTAIKRHLVELKRLVRVHRAGPQEGLIAALNPVIRGWCNYYRTAAAKRIFSTCDHYLYQMLRSWAAFRHPNKEMRWVVKKYWGQDQGQGWKFQAPDGSVLAKHASTPIKRHVKVKGTASPYDGNVIYWAQRLKDHPLTSKRTGYLLKLQQGRCGYCGRYFQPGEALETDHIIPRRLGGDDRLLNLQLLHRHCHDQKTAQDGSHQARGGQVSLTKTI
jgi:RNA-directed DNA polymerase